MGLQPELSLGLPQLSLPALSVMRHSSPISKFKTFHFIILYVVFPRFAHWSFAFHFSYQESVRNSESWPAIYMPGPWYPAYLSVRIECAHDIFVIIHSYTKLFFKLIRLRPAQIFYEGSSFRSNPGHLPSWIILSRIYFPKAKTVRLVVLYILFFFSLWMLVNFKTGSRK